jgi:hypothetical protein
MRRLGTLSSSGPRRLLVRLSSEHTASELLSVSRRLRHSEDPYVARNIYLNPDLSPEDARAAFEKRQNRRMGFREPGGAGAVEGVDRSSGATTGIRGARDHNGEGASYSGVRVVTNSKFIARNENNTQSRIHHWGAGGRGGNDTEDTEHVAVGGVGSRMNAAAKSFTPASASGGSDSDISDTHPVESGAGRPT